MYVYELYKNDTLQDILVVDCGIGFPQEKELGVDFVIPDITYLEDKLDKIRALLITHGHEDHIGAIPYLYEKLGHPKIFTSKLTSMFIINKLREYRLVPEMEVVKFATDYTFGGFKARFIPVTHSIPDPTHIVIKSPIGSFYHGPDYKLDLTPPYGTPPDFYEITKAGKDGLLCLFSDALGSDRDGLTVSESVVGETFEDEMRKTKGKFIMTTFASNISRIRQCCEAAIKFNRAIIFMGRSMRENTRLAAEIGYLPIPESLMGKEEDVSRLPQNKVCLIVAGSQGQYDSALYKIARKQNKNVRIKSGDKIIFSSDPIPGNENEVYALIEELSLQGADVVYTGIQGQLHASGHGSREDLKFLMRFTNSKYLLPIGGTIRHQREYQKLAIGLGYKKENILLIDEGNSIWFTKGHAQPGDTIETKNIYVDSSGVGEVGNGVLQDRKTLSSEGMVVAICVVDAHGQLISMPKIVSKGFVLEKNEDKLFNDAAKVIQKLITPTDVRLSDSSALKQQIAKKLENFFFEARGRRPIVVVDVIEM